MPLPKPNKGEERKKFLSRCMDSETMKSEYPNIKQRVAVCNSLFENKKKKKD